MPDTTYTAITFAPVQGFIEKSRKLRDLYGSSFILSYLSRTLCEAAEKQELKVISPAIIDVVRGTPNQIIIQGNFEESQALAVFHQAWDTLTWTCRQWIEKQIPGKYNWRKDWEMWTKHAWEFFWANGQTISEARRKLNKIKGKRSWTGINWQGESSTLSGADAIAYPNMGSPTNPKDYNYTQEKSQISQFYTQLRQLKPLGEAFIDESEQLSIPELIKRLITYDVIATQINLKPNELPSVEIPQTFRDLNRLSEKRWTGWFQGDGDSIGKYLIQISESANEAQILHDFSQSMLDWGEKALIPSVKQKSGKVIYAGGDDFLGVFFRDKAELKPQECLNWFYEFPKVWEKHGRELTVSVGFVWAGGGVPQRDVLQHCREAEKSAKNHGRDRLALRVLFNGGNYLEWVCPWWFLPEVLGGYGDRENGKNWTHIYNDVAVLQSRHAFEGNQSEVALGLFTVYFGEQLKDQLLKHLWNVDEKAGILGKEETEPANTNTALNNWIINLAKVGFHLCH
ncbi:Cas10/Cmr2 second palm domain-containing protein [Floridanema aerugineum]|uniref:Type III-B CRISPR-associated protein Cas10/Cmr2 n=1 Tax=Floridaenema aerugineum BLCC-F46 TaxID=3153654 RepID=A0ABV4WYT5_9CYAN